MSNQDIYRSAAFQLMPNTAYLPTRNNGVVNAGQLASLLRQWFPGHAEKNEQIPTWSGAYIPIAEPYSVRDGGTSMRWHILETNSQQVVYTLRNTPGVNPEADRAAAIRLAGDIDALRAAQAEDARRHELVSKARSGNWKPRQSEANALLNEALLDDDPAQTTFDDLDCESKSPHTKAVVKDKKHKNISKMAADSLNKRE